jgi:hypothetical protein
MWGEGGGGLGRRPRKEGYAWIISQRVGPDEGIREEREMKEDRELISICNVSENLLISR